MLKLASTPRIARQDRYFLSYQVRSRSRDNIVHPIIILDGGTYECNCEAFRWGNTCWHKTITTLNHPTFTLLGKALEVLKTKKDKQPIYAWEHIGCTFREFYRADRIYCDHCPLYPVTCNIHPIKYDRQKKPLIWKLQTAIIRGKRKTAIRLLKQFIKVVAAEKLKFHQEAYD